jgi:hypothetical protein
VNGCFDHEEQEGHEGKKYHLIILRVLQGLHGEEKFGE